MAKYAGLDIAMRIDATALVALENKAGILEEIGLRTWNKINYNTVQQDILKIQRKEKFRSICFDRLGSGEVVTTWTRELPLKEVISSVPKKIDLIGLVKSLFHSGKLVIHTAELYKEILAQITYKSPAGNVLYMHPSGHHDDRFWGLAYACEAARPYIQGIPKYTVGYSAKPKTIDEEIEALLKNV